MSQKETRVDRLLRRLKDHPAVAVVVVASLAIIALANLTAALEKLISPLTPTAAHVRLDTIRVRPGGGGGAGQQPTLDVVLVNDGPQVSVLKAISAKVLSGNEEICLPILRPSSRYFIDISGGSGRVSAANELLPNRAERIIVDLFRGCKCCTPARIQLTFEFSKGESLVSEVSL